jgi:hypothetical protein
MLGSFPIHPEHVIISVSVYEAVVGQAAALDKLPPFVEFRCLTTVLFFVN